MMAKAENDIDDDIGGKGEAVRFAKIALAATGLLFFLGLAAGLAGAMIQTLEVKPAVAAIAAVSAALAALCGWQLYRLEPFSAGEGPISPKVLRARRAIGMSVIVGVVLGLIMSIPTFTGDDPLGAFSNTPVPPWIAAAAIAVWLLVVPLLSLRWWRSIDEHEASAYRSGAVAGFYFYIFATPSWWMAWRGGFLPEPMPMLIFIVAMIIWGIGWMRGRQA